MMDTQPLLSKPMKLDTSDTCDNGNKKKHSTNSLFGWFRTWRRKQKDDEYTNLDDDNENTAYYQPVNPVRLFRFADRIDWVSMLIGLFVTVIHTTCVIFDIVIFGRLSGLFVTHSFGNYCAIENATTISPITLYTTYPQRIDPIIPDHSSLHSHNVTTSLPTTVSSASSFVNQALVYVYWLLAIGAIEFVVAWIQYYIWNITVKRQTFRMRVALLQSLIQRNISYMDNQQPSKLHDKLSNNIDKIEQGIGFEFIALVGTIFCIFGSLIASFSVDWTLTLILFCLIPIIIGSSVISSKLIARETMNELKTYSKAGQLVQEVFSSLRTVHSLNGSKFEQKRYEQELASTRWASIRKGVVLGVFAGFLALLTYSVYLIGFIFGPILMSTKIDHDLNISDVLVVVFMFAYCLNFFSLVGPFFQAFSEARGAAAPVFQLIDEGNDSSINENLVSNDDKKTIHEINGDIEFENVSFFYPNRKDAPIMRNLSFVARAGQTTALVGSSGSGKSTCVSLLLRYYAQSTGNIKINDRPIAEYDIQQLRQNIGVVNQEPILFATTIYENIRFGKLDATRAEIEEAARISNAHDFIMRLPINYETLVGERGVQLSGGEKQRIALARALIRKPRFLLLDEATSALDNHSEKIVQDALDRACQGRTTIVIAHRLSTIQNADKIYVLDKGSVIEQGTHETLMAKQGGKYQSMVKHQEMKKIDDEEVDNIPVEAEQDKEERAIFQRSCSVDDGEIIQSYQSISRPFTHRFVFLRLLAMNRPEWFIVLVACITCILIGAAESAFAFILVAVIDAFKYCSLSERRHHVVYAGLWFLLLGLVLFILRIFQFTAFAISGSKLTQRMRSKAFACLLRQEVAYFDEPENSSGAISSRLAKDAVAIQEMTGTRLGVICEVIALIFFAFVFGCTVNWQLAIIMLSAIAIIFIITIVNVKFNLKLNKVYEQINGRANTVASEAIHNMRTIKQQSLEKEILERYSMIISQSLKVSYQPYVMNAISYAAVWMIDVYIMAFLAWRAMYLVKYHELEPIRLVMILALSVISIQVLGVLEVMASRMSTSDSVAQGFFKLLDRKPTIDNTSNEGLKLADFRGDIRFDQVEFSYPTRPINTILNKFQLKIDASQRVALIGGSGSGKSTVIQLLERFYDAKRGHILIDGVDIQKLNLQWLRSKFGLVSQEPILFDLTIAENIAYGLENVSMADIFNAANKANIHQFIEQLPQGYETRVGAKGSFLSGGEKQRIAIARVLVRQPKVLLLDEATSAMDSNNEKIVQEALEQAQLDDSNRTSLVIAHRLSTIRSCDLICVIEKGRIVERGNHGELIQKHGLYYSMLDQATYHDL